MGYVFSIKISALMSMCADLVNHLKIFSNIKSTVLGCRLYQGTLLHTSMHNCGSLTLCLNIEEEQERGAAENLTDRQLIK